MKLPSIQLLTNSLVHICKRFPFVLLSAFIGTAAGILLIRGDYKDEPLATLSKIMMVSSLGVPLFFAMHIFCERTLAKPMFRFVAFISGLFVLIQFYFSMSSWAVHNGQIFYRFFFWSAGLHLFVAFSAFFIEDELAGFWQFNKQLFLRFLTSALYSGVLYLGLAGAILAVAQLFNVDFHGEIYAELWLVIAGLFNTVFFLGGIAEPVAGLNNETSYPKGLKIFTQYVLIPLVAIYLIILYAYTAKILIRMSLPKGWVANLILGFSVTGILSLLLVYPIREEEENKWIKTFSHFYYFSLVPLVVLLFVAIGTRVSAYGVTVERYIVAMLGVWLAVITLYFIFSKKKNIILIPITLSVFLFCSCFGPWGMFKVSERSQLKRLHTLLESNGVFKQNKIVKLSTEQADKVKVVDINQINSIIEYLGKDHGLKGMKDWFSADCAQNIFTDSLDKDVEGQIFEIKNCIGLYGVTGYRSDEDLNEINLNFYCSQFNDVNGMDISGYDRIYQFNAYDYKGEGNSVDYAAASFTRLKENEMQFYLKGKRQFTLPLDSIAHKLKMLQHTKHNTYTTTPADMTFDIANVEGDKIRLMFSNFNTRITDTSTVVNSINGYLLLKKE
jgi:hypothetical protein